jgi:hypothetical protein
MLVNETKMNELRFAAKQNVKLLFLVTLKVILINMAVELLKQISRSDITLLHCQGDISKLMFND